nr:GAD domain-containing protein [Mycoplasmopsis cynos]
MKKVLNIDIKIPFERIEYDECISKYGTDKPDFRYQNIIVDINNFCNNTEFNIIKNAPSKRLLKINEKITKKEFKILEEIAKKNGVNALFYFVVENNEIVHSNFASKVLNEVNLLVKTYEDKADGSYFITANKYDKASQALGAIRVELN